MINNFNGYIIDPKKILEKKKSKIQKDYEYLLENYTVLNSINFLQKIRNYPLNDILENSQYIHNEERGTDFLNYVLKTNDLSLKDIQFQMLNVNKSLQNTNLSENHKLKLNECLSILQEKEMKYNDIEYLKHDTTFNLIVSNIPKPIMESNVVNKMDNIIQNINYQPEIIEKYEEMIHEIKKWKGKTIITNFVPLLLKNTSLVIGMTVLIVGSALTLITSLPLLLVSKLIEQRIDKKYISSFIYIISKEIKKIEQIIKHEDQRKKKILEDYLQSLKSAREKLLKYDIYSKRFKGVREHIGTMNPIPQYDTIAQMEKEIEEMIEKSDELNLQPIEESYNNSTKDFDKQTIEKFAELYIDIRDFLLDENNCGKIFVNDYTNFLRTKKDIIKLDSLPKNLAHTSIMREDQPIKFAHEIMNKIIKKFNFIEINNGRLCHKEFPTIQISFQISYVPRNKFNFDINLLLVKPEKVLNNTYYNLDKNNLSINTDEYVDMYEKFIEISQMIKDYILSHPDYSKLFIDEPDININKVDLLNSSGLFILAQSKPSYSHNSRILSRELLHTIATKFNFIETTSDVYINNEYPFITLTSSIIKIDNENSDFKQPLFSVCVELILDTSPEKIQCPKQTLENNIYIKLTDFLFDETDNSCLESFSEIINLIEKHGKITEMEDILESKNSVLRKTALKAEDATKKTIKKIRDLKTKNKHTTVVLKRIPTHIDNFINNTLNKIKEMDKNERRNRIVEGTFRKKILKIVRNAIVLGAEWAISPALSAITLLAGIALDKKADKKVKNQILQELNLELKIVDEKLEDSRSDGNRKSKYELMRIKNKLEQEIDRIRYNL